MASKKKAVDLTLQVLVEIRDGVRNTNARLESLERSTNARLESLERSTSDRLDEVTARLAELRKAQVESEVRLATELVALAGVISNLQQA
jgi:hypothetical protein